MTAKPLDKILTFVPKYKSVIWGGTRISELKGEPCPEKRIGESWEISALQGQESVVAEGSHKGESIADLSLTYGKELLGEKVVKNYGKRFPLLVKLLDAHDILSLQVHPNDLIAKQRHNALGKSEMWYVIDAKKDARIYCGLTEQITADNFNSRIHGKSIMDVVGCYASKPGQFYFIPSGTIHSIGGGNLLAEIQESSDITYRVYDHDRTDADGKPRQLHIEQACEAIDFSSHKAIEVASKTFDSSERNVVKSEHFAVDYFKIDNRVVDIPVNHDSFTVVLVTAGTLTIHADGEVRTLTAGHTALIPASVTDLKLEGSGIALSAHI